MKYRKWGEWGWVPEQFVVVSDNDKQYVFSVKRIPDASFEGRNVLEEFLTDYRKEVEELYQEKKPQTPFEVKMVWEYGLSIEEEKRRFDPNNANDEWFQKLHKRALEVKQRLEDYIRRRGEITGLVEEGSNDTDSASVERPDNIPSFPIDSFLPVVPDGSVPVPFVASRKDTVSSCTSEVKQPDDESTRHLRNIDKEDKQHTKQLTSIQTVLQEGNEITREGFARLLDRLELQQPHATLKDAEQTPPPSPEPEETDNQIDWDALEKELASVKGSEVNDKGYLGKQRLIMRENYGFSVRQIWEYENPGSIWKQLSPYERKSASNSINESIKNARKKQSEK